MLPLLCSVFMLRYFVFILVIFLLFFFPSTVFFYLLNLSFFLRSAYQSTYSLIHSYVSSFFILFFTHVLFFLISSFSSSSCSYFFLFFYQIPPFSILGNLLSSCPFYSHPFSPLCVAVPPSLLPIGPRRLLFAIAKLRFA